MNRLSLFALLLALFATGCVNLDAAARRDLDAAAVTLDEQLDAPGLLATTALLYHAQRGSYPTTPFELLGSDAARETGLQNLKLSHLAVSMDADSLRLGYALLPTVADPSLRLGQVSVAETDTAGVYTVGLMMNRTADPDFGGRTLPLAQRGTVNVMRARGTLCAEVETVRERLRAGAAIGAPPLTEGEAYKITFTASEGRIASGALRDGVTVTLPR